MKYNSIEIKELVSSFFPVLKEKEIDLFLSICTYQVFKNKEIILKKGRTDNNLFIILKGAARSYEINTEGKEINNHLRAEGFIFGDARVFGNDKQILDVEAIGEIHILKFDVLELEQLAYKNKLIMKFYLNILKEIILTFSHRIHTFVSMTAKERYENLIKWNPDYLDSTFDKHIATFLGITPLTLYRIKKSM